MRNILWLFVSLFTFFSCSIEIEGDEDRLLIGNDFANHDEIELRREISLLMGSVLLDKEAANLALDYARFKNDNSESISLAALACTWVVCRKNLCATANFYREISCSLAFAFASSKCFV